MNLNPYMKAMEIMKVGSVTFKKKYAPGPHIGCFLPALDHSLSCRSKSFHFFIRKPVEKDARLWGNWSKKWSQQRLLKPEYNTPAHPSTRNYLQSSIGRFAPWKNLPGNQVKREIAETVIETGKVEPYSLAILQKIAACILIQKDCHLTFFKNVQRLFSYENLSMRRLHAALL